MGNRMDKSTIFAHHVHFRMEIQKILKNCLGASLHGTDRMIAIGTKIIYLRPWIECVSKIKVL